MGVLEKVAHRIHKAKGYISIEVIFIGGLVLCLGIILILWLNVHGQEAGNTTVEKINGRVDEVNNRNPNLNNGGEVEEEDIKEELLEYSFEFVEYQNMEGYAFRLNIPDGAEVVRVYSNAPAGHESGETYIHKNGLGTWENNVGLIISPEQYTEMRNNGDYYTFKISFEGKSNTFYVIYNNEDSVLGNPSTYFKTVDSIDK